jgi:Na+/proline symporter
MAAVDYWILAGYFVVTLLVGLVMTRRASSSLEHYFLGGRQLPWWLLGVAGMTAWFDLTGTMIITSFLYMLGPRGLFIEFRGGAVLILAFLLAYAGKWHRRSGVMTAPEWLTYRFGQDRASEALRLVTAMMTIILTVGMLAYLVRGTSLFMGTFFPFPPMYTTAAVIALTALYTVCAGFYGVVLTDLVQGIIILIACVIVAVLAWMKVPDTAALSQIAQSVTGNTTWTSSAPAWRTEMPVGYEAYQALGMFMLFYLARNVLGGMGSGAEQRFFAARSDRECGLQSLLQGVMVAFRWPLMMGFAVLGILLVHQMYPRPDAITSAHALVLQHHPNTPEGLWHDLTAGIASNPQLYSPELIGGLEQSLGADWRDKLSLVGFKGTINPEQVLPAVLMNQIPAGLKGLLVVAMLAAMMSTATGAVNGAGAVIVKDVYQNFLRPLAGQRELIAVAWISSAAIVAVGFWMGVMAESINSLWSWIVMSLTAGGLAPGLLRLYWWRCNAWGMFGGTLLGGIGAVVQRVAAPEMAEWQQFLLMTGLSFAGTIAFSLLTPATPMHRLVHFYRTTRPFGWWGPVRRAVAGDFTPEQWRTIRTEHRNDLLTVPFTLLAQVTLFLMPMQLVIQAYTSFALTLPLFLVGLAGMYVFWWKRLDDGEALQRLVETERQREIADRQSGPAPALAGSH